ncbi:MAG: prevent-host-death protein [Ruminococcus sp.]|nr:prevent-host-death protein [Ruminococcus sp.]
MPNVKPVSDLQNYSEVLANVAADNPVFLTRNGSDEYKRQRAALKIMAEIAKGRIAADEQGWLTPEEVERELGI